VNKKEIRILIYLGMIDVSKVVEGPSDPNLVSMFLADFQMPSTTNNSFFKLAHHFQGVAEVARGFGLPQPVSHGAGKSQVMFVVLRKKSNLLIWKNLLL